MVTNFFNGTQQENEKTIEKLFTVRNKSAAEPLKNATQQENEKQVEKSFTVRNKVIEKSFSVIDAHLAAGNDLSQKERSGFLFKQIFDLKFKKE